MSSQFFYVQLNFRPKIGAESTFPTVTEGVIGLYEEDPPIWCADRPQVMNERHCDNEVNGTRAWKVV
jgi:hypothetical protein